ncbi:MAG: sarcosine oxidase subunit gamma [Pseudomonadota bacterium]
MSDATITLPDPMGMITVRGDLDGIGTAVTAVTGAEMPGRRLSAEGARGRVHWMSPDELLVTCDHDAAPGLAADLTEALADRFATVAVVSDARVVIDLTGPDADDVLATLTPADLTALAPTEVRRTRLAQIAAAFWRIEGGYRIVAFRSMATYLHDILANATGAHPAVQDR